MHLVPFQAIYPNLDLVASPESFFGTVKAQFVEYLENGFFKRSSQESIYVYQLMTPSSLHKGVITSTDINDFTNGAVLKHENTLAAKEQQMMNLMMQNKAMVKPVLLAYDRVSEIDVIIDGVIQNEKPFFEINFEDKGERHSVWQLSDGPMVAKLIELFKEKVPKSYVADGHHRIKTSILLNETDTKNEQLDTKLTDVLSIYFAWDELSIYDYNRCVDAFQNTSPLQFMAKLSKYFKISYLQKPKRPKSKHEMTMLLYGEWYRLRVRKEIIKKHKDEVVLFDTFILNEYVLKDILGMENVREDTRVKYVDGVAGLLGMEEMVSKNENRVGFCLFPIRYQEVKIISEHNKTLPPKSTWFEPRIKNGVIVKEF